MQTVFDEYNNERIFIDLLETAEIVGIGAREIAEKLTRKEFVDHVLMLEPDGQIVIGFYMEEVLAWLPKNKLNS